MPPLSEEDRRVALPPVAESLERSTGPRALTSLAAALRGRADPALPRGTILGQFGITLLPLLTFVVFMGTMYYVFTSPAAQVDTTGIQAMGIAGGDAAQASSDSGGLAEPEAEPENGLKEPPAEKEAEPAAPAQAEPAAKPAPKVELERTPGPAAAAAERLPAPIGYWIALALGALAVAVFYRIFSFARLEIFKMLLGSFFPLAMLIVAVLGSIVFGLATPSEAAAAGALGGLLLAAAYGRLNLGVVRESAFLTAKTSAMVCWLFVGSSIFSASFALLGGQEIIEHWVLSLGLTPVQFLVLAQVIIFLLGWPLEWTEIIVIFMPIFIPLLPKFGIDPLFFGLLVALNLQTAFLSPPVAMAAFYLKGVAPRHVTLNQIFAGMMPFMAIQVFAVFLLYQFPAIGMWLPSVLYGR
ncbi:unnamed protein product [Phaeothamnion confervicola]